MVHGNEMTSSLANISFTKFIDCPAAAPVRVVVAMSGGVDSSVVAALMQRAGHDVIGITLQLYDHGQAAGRKGSCCAGQDVHDARRVAHALSIPHYVLRGRTGGLKKMVHGNEMTSSLANISFTKFIDCPAAAPVRVVVAMSGGVDSSVVAALMQRAGHDVIGITLQLYDHGQAAGRKSSCCAGQDVHDARRVAHALSIPHYVLDYESRFAEAVMDPFAESYMAGETPIPCVTCNQQILLRPR